MTISATATANTLSALLRDGSRSEHTEAEESGFMSRMLKGEVAPDGYAEYLLRLHAVYTALERVGRALAGDPLVSAVHDPDLERLAAIERDLDHWLGAGWAERTIDSPAAEAYVARIDASASWGGLYVAHHYTRYLGDLSGGQAIGKILARAYEIDDERGVEFYAFPAIPKPKPYKDAYRYRLDALPLDEAERHRVLGEVKVVFALNGALFDELNTLTA